MSNAASALLLIFIAIRLIAAVLVASGLAVLIILLLLLLLTIAIGMIGLLALLLLICHFPSPANGRVMLACATPGQPPAPGACSRAATGRGRAAPIAFGAAPLIVPVNNSIHLNWFF